jgi:hypothetical protein
MQLLSNMTKSQVICPIILRMDEKVQITWMKHCAHLQLCIQVDYLQLFMLPITLVSLYLY